MRKFNRLHLFFNTVVKPRHRWRNCITSMKDKQDASMAQTLSILDDKIMIKMVGKINTGEKL